MSHSPMISQPQRDNNEGQRRDDGEPTKSSQTTARHGATSGIDGPNSPKGCGMQRLVGHQMDPWDTFEVSRSHLDAAIEPTGNDEP